MNVKRGHACQVLALLGLSLALMLTIIFSAWQNRMTAMTRDTGVQPQATPAIAASAD